MQRSKLIQKQIKSLYKVEKEFAPTETHENTRSTTTATTTTSPHDHCKEEIIPIVLVPTSPSFVQLSITIPSGPYYVFWQQWDKDMGELQPGTVRCWPAWNRVSHVVTRAPVSYGLPVKDCPTSDDGKPIVIILSMC